MPSRKLIYTNISKEVQFVSLFDGDCYILPDDLNLYMKISNFNLSNQLTFSSVNITDGTILLKSPIMVIPVFVKIEVSPDTTARLTGHAGYEEE